MLKRLFVFCALLICFCLSSFSQVNNEDLKLDTLRTVNGGKVILEYKISIDNKKLCLTFNRANFKLYKPKDKKYDKEKLDVVIFDKRGGFGDVEFKNNGWEIKTINIPADAFGYKTSEYGYFRFEEDDTLKFGIKSDKKAALTLPVYLMYYKRKNKYEIIDRCQEDLRISLPEKKQNGVRRIEGAEIGHITVTITDTIETASDPTETRVINLKEETKNLLNSSNVSDYFQEIEHNIKELEGYKSALLENNSDESDSIETRIFKLIEVTDNLLNSSNIDHFQEIEHNIKELEGYKSALLENNSDESLLDTIDDLRNTYDSLRRKHEGYKNKLIQIRQTIDDSIRKANEFAQKEAEEKREKRNIFLIIGGALLGVLCFVGNQVFQHFRSVRNARNMMELQQDIAFRAESEARNYARKKTNEYVNKVKKNTRQSMGNQNTKRENGKANTKTKKISI